MRQTDVTTTRRPRQKPLAQMDNDELFQASIRCADEGKDEEALLCIGELNRRANGNAR